MKTTCLLYTTTLLCFTVTTSCSQEKPDPTKAATVKSATAQQTINLPPPYQSKSVNNYCDVIGWPANKTPTAPAGFKVSLFATNLDNPRNIYVAPNGDVFCIASQHRVKGC
jgi:glucose/arabinose dehydrogenase